jgi:toxin FitB
MRYLLDTCVWSEGARGDVAPAVAAWFERTDDGLRYASVLSLAEFQYGILRLPDGRKKVRLGLWYETELLPRLENRIMIFGEAEALMWARLRVSYPNAPHIDAQIAATAYANEMTLVTRNAKDFRFDGLAVLNPWEEG